MSVEVEQPGRAAQKEEWSRREFLNYAWLASLGFLTLQTGVVLYQFAVPSLSPGEFGGPVDIGSIDRLPGVGVAPLAYNKARFWWVVTDAGALALYKVCTHLSCIYDWQDVDDKFICPCHGTQFDREGRYIQGPAPRGLDRFVIRAVDARGREVARTGPHGDPVSIPPGADVIVETGQRIFGPPKA